MRCFFHFCSSFGGAGFFFFSLAMISTWGTLLKQVIFSSFLSKVVLSEGVFVMRSFQNCRPIVLLYYHTLAFLFPLFSSYSGSETFPRYSSLFPSSRSSTLSLLKRPAHQVPRAIITVRSTQIATPISIRTRMIHKIPQFSPFSLPSPTPAAPPS